MNANAPGEYRNRSVEKNRSFSQNAWWRGWGVPLFVTIFFRKRYSAAVMWIPITKQLFCNCLFMNLFELCRTLVDVVWLGSWCITCLCKLRESVYVDIQIFKSTNIPCSLRCMKCHKSSLHHFKCFVEYRMSHRRTCRLSKSVVCQLYIVLTFSFLFGKNACWAVYNFNHSVPVNCML